MTLNERVFRQNINIGPSIANYHLSINLYIILYLWICGLFQKLRVHFELIANIQLCMLQWYQSEVTIWISRVSQKNRPLSFKKSEI